MKKIISILFILCGIFSSMAYAQGGLTYSGTVIGEDGLELIGECCCERDIYRSNHRLGRKVPFE